LESDDDYLAKMGYTFEPETVKLFQILAHGTVLDIGANIGCTALLFSQLADQVYDGYLEKFSLAYTHGRCD